MSRNEQNGSNTALTAESELWRRYTSEYLDSRADQIGDAPTLAQVEFIQQSLGLKVGAMILDLACGNGRHGNKLAAKGYHVIGGDYSEDLVRVADSSTPSSHAKAGYVRLDMRQLPFRETFDGVISMYSSFGMFENEADNVVTLQSIAGTLKPQGVFLLDQDSLAQRIRRALSGGTLHDPNTGTYTVTTQHEQNSGPPVSATTTLDLATMWENWVYEYDNEQGQHVISHGKVRRFSLPEMVHLLSEAGFQVDQVRGGYDGQPYTGNSGRMIIKAIKAAPHPTQQARV